MIVRGIATAEELHAYHPVIAEVVNDSARRQSGDRIDNYATYFEQVTNVWRLSDAAREIVFNPRFARLAAQLLGASAVRLYHDQALFKPPGAPRTPWHRDSYYWPLDHRQAITMWLPLVEVDDDMGTMVFASGSHLDPTAGLEPISEEGDRRMAQLIASKRWRTSPARVRLGDATFHGAATVHCAGPNRSSKPRDVLTVIYYADGIHALAPENPHQEVDLRTFLPGVAPGEPAVSELNPLLAGGAL